MLKKLVTCYTFNPSLLFLGIYNTILELCAQTNNLEMAEDFVERMIADGVAPDIATMQAVKQKRAMRGLVRKLWSYMEEPVDG